MCPSVHRPVDLVPLLVRYSRPFEMYITYRLSCQSHFFLLGLAFAGAVTAV